VTKNFFFFFFFQKYLIGGTLQSSLCPQATGVSSENSSIRRAIAMRKYFCIKKSTSRTPFMTCGQKTCFVCVCVRFFWSKTFFFIFCAHHCEHIAFLRPTEYDVHMCDTSGQVLCGTCHFRHGDFFKKKSITQIQMRNHRFSGGSREHFTRGVFIPKKNSKVQSCKLSKKSIFPKNVLSYIFKCQIIDFVGVAASI